MIFVAYKELKKVCAYNKCIFRNVYKKILAQDIWYCDEEQEGNNPVAGEPTAVEIGGDTQG